jgi:predicted  nucleic acid-binding Zn-ribbon protein
MDVVASIAVVDIEGGIADVALRLEAYDLRSAAWRSIEDIVPNPPTIVKASVEGERQRLAVSLQLAGFLELFAVTASFRLAAVGADMDTPQVIFADAAISNDAQTFAMDFGTVLYLGREHGFATAQDARAPFCAGISLAGGDDKLAAAQRRFYSDPFALDEADADRARLRGQIAELLAGAAALQQALTQCRMDGEGLARANTAGAAERDRLTAQVAALNSGLNACAAARDGLDARLAVVTEQVRQAVSAQQEAEVALADCRERGSALERTLTASAAALEACGTARSALETRLAAAEIERDAATDKATGLELERGMLTAQLDSLRAQTTDAKGHFDNLQAQLLSQTAKASAAVQNLDLVRSQQRSAVPADTLFKTLASAVGDATMQLSKAASPYQIGRADFKLKAFVSSDGGLMSMPDAAHLAGNPALSEVHLELMRNDAPAAPAAGGIVVPDLLGLTETAVIQVLASLSLKAAKAVEMLADQPENHGRAMRQIPKAGSSVAKAETVLVVYGSQKGDLT